MPIPFTCPYCGHQVMVADQYIGQTGPCSKCGQMVTITSMGTGMAGFAAQPAPKRKSGGASVGIVLGIIGGVVLLLLLCCGGGALFFFRSAGVAVTQVRGAAQRTQCVNNLKQIGLALHNYHDVNQSFPPAYIADANGKPMHSWRVLILPYLDQQALYQQYRFDEPWDGPHNSQLAARMPPVFHCPDDPAGTSQTHYLAVSGPGTAFDGSQGARISAFTDGLSNTLLVVESTKATNWMAPVDLDAAEMSFVINDPTKPAIGSPHEGGANLLYGDGSVHFATPAVSAETIRGLTTRAGNEVPGPDAP